MSIRFLSLFAGIGGFDLGLERAGWECVGQVEIDPFCRAVLEKHWPGTPRWEDVRRVSGAEIIERCGPVEAVVGGFPCQDISAAGKGAGIHAERSGLWWEMLRLVRELRPVWVLAENVPALRTRGADDVLGALEEHGYACWPVVVGAWAVGAPHKRDRVWVVGHAESRGAQPEQPQRDHGHERRREEAERPVSGAAGGGDVRGAAEGTSVDGGTVAVLPGDVADASRPRLEERRDGAGGTGAELPLPAGGGRPRWPSRPGEPQHEWEPPRLVNAAQRGREPGAGLRGDAGSSGGREPAGADGRERQPQPGLGGLPDGLPPRLVSLARRSALRAYGNSIVPQVAEAIGRAISRSVK